MSKNSTLIGDLIDAACELKELTVRLKMNQEVREEMRRLRHEIEGMHNFAVDMEKRTARTDRSRERWSIRASTIAGILAIFPTENANV